MAPGITAKPKEASKVKVQSNVMKPKPGSSKTASSPATVVNKKPIEKVTKNNLKTNAALVVKKLRSSATLPMATGSKGKNSVPLSKTVADSSKKRLWRPLPAHSGVPVPEKMRRNFKKMQEKFNESLSVNKCT